MSSSSPCPATFGYDANGNLLSDGTTAYGYDAENRLILTGGQVYLYYDPLGRLWQSSTGQTGVTQFVYDGDALVAEYDGANTLLRRYVHGTSADVPEQWFEGAGLADPHYLFADHQGSIVATFQPSVPRTAVNAYDEYGIPDARNVGRFGYTGQAWIPELGMYYYKARMYSPTLGRFLQTDPIGYDDQINLYAYVGNDPVNGRDPTGMAGQTGSGCTGTFICPDGNTLGATTSTINPGLQGAGTSDGGGMVRSAGSASGRFSSQNDFSVFSLSVGVVTRVGWQNPTQHAGNKAGAGWRLYVTSGDGSRYMYGHLNPKSTMEIGKQVEVGSYLGRYANPTNGHSSGPHVHVQYFNKCNRIRSPGLISPLGPDSHVTTPFGVKDRMHPKAHQGTDWVDD